MIKQFVFVVVFGFGFVRPATGIAELIYWTDRFHGTISVADTKTGIISTIVNIPSLTPWGIAVDQSSKNIYFTNGTNSGDTNASVDVVGISGTGLTSLATSASATRQIVLDQANGKMYWTSETAAGVYEANLDGSGKNLIVTGLYNPRGLAIDLTTHKLFFDTLLPNESARTIMSSNLDGSSIHTILTGQDTNIWGMTIDPVAHQLYWGTTFGNEVLRANEDGTGTTTILSGLITSVYSVQIDPAAGYIYAAGDATYYGGTGGAIIRANLDGTNVTTLFSGVEATNIFITPSSNTVPEPSSFALLGLGGIGVVIGAYRRNQRQLDGKRGKSVGKRG